jgi:hypothetical protein
MIYKHLTTQIMGCSFGKKRFDLEKFVNSLDLGRFGNHIHMFPETQFNGHPNVCDISCLPVIGGQFTAFG